MALPCGRSGWGWRRAGAIRPGLLLAVAAPWAAGVGGTTATYSIYLSTNANAVTNGQASALLQTQDASSTIVLRDPSDALNPNTVYFWRVDANGPGGTTTGPVLTFTTGSIPQPVTTPSPPM